MNPLFVLAIAIFCTMLGNGVVMPFIPLYAQQFGAASLGQGSCSAPIRLHARFYCP